MDLLAQLDELTYSEDVIAAEMKQERKERWERLYKKYEGRSKKRRASISLEEFEHHYPDTNKRKVENPHTRSFRKYLKQHGDLIDELTTVAGEPASDEEELSCDESESEEEYVDFGEVATDYDNIETFKSSKNVLESEHGDETHHDDHDGLIASETESYKMGNLSFDENNDDEDFLYSAGHNKLSNDNIETFKSSKNVEESEHGDENQHDDLSMMGNLSFDVDDEDFLYSAGPSKLSNPLLGTPHKSNPQNPIDKKPFTTLVTPEVAEDYELADESRDDSIVKWLSRMTCTECRKDVESSPNMEEPDKFICDDCLLEYDHGCDPEKDCEVCREIAMWVQVRWEVTKQISKGGLDHAGIKEEDHVAVYNGLCRLACIQCGVETDIPAGLEEPSSFKCDKCLLGDQHGCNIDQDCDECREIVITVQARREAIKKINKNKVDDNDNMEKVAIVRKNIDANPSKKVEERYKLQKSLIESLDLSIIDQIYNTKD